MENRKMGNSGGGLLLKNEDTGMIYKQVVSADALSSIITMPPKFRNKKVELTIRAVEDGSTLPKIDLSELDKMMEGSITQSLIGIVADSGISLDEYRDERLSKYESAD